MKKRVYFKFLITVIHLELMIFLKKEKLLEMIKKMSLTKFLSDIEDIKRLDLDLIIVGSDVVWNTKNIWI